MVVLGEIVGCTMVTGSVCFKSITGDQKLGLCQIFTLWCTGVLIRCDIRRSSKVAQFQAYCLRLHADSCQVACRAKAG